jgi:hypothetical protein
MNPQSMPVQSCAAVAGSYHAELSGDLLDPHGHLIDLVINFAFETLGASHVDLRVTPSSRFQGAVREPNTRTHLPS